jgi:hypothetical protein
VDSPAYLGEDQLTDVLAQGRNGFAVEANVADYTCAALSGATVAIPMRSHLVWSASTTT